MRCGVSEEAWLSLSHRTADAASVTILAHVLSSVLVLPQTVTPVCGLRRDHLLSSYAAGVARELAADADKLNLAKTNDDTGDDVQVAVRRNSALVQRLKSLVRRSGDDSRQ
jgi:hypothetical protein